VNSQQPTTIAILGTNALVENVLAQLLEGEGYAIRVLLNTFPLGESAEEELPFSGDADLVILAPSLSTSDCDVFLAARRRTTRQRRTPTTATSPIPVIVLSTPGKEAQLLEEEQAARSVPWPTTRERLVREIEELFLEARFSVRTQRSNRRR
jgi:CheY-like chemotaxis protein